MHINDESVTTLEDLRGDLALRHKWTASSGTSVDPAIVEADMAALDRDGYVVWENLLTDQECRQIRDTVLPWLSEDRCIQLAAECLELYCWDRLGVEN